LQSGFQLGAIELKNTRGSMNIGLARAAGLLNKIFKQAQQYKNGLRLAQGFQFLVL
jgi:hypothetical protein